MLPRYPIPWNVVLRLVVAVLRCQPRSFRKDALACMAKLRPPLRVFGEENIPARGPCLATVNHYSRPGFGAWWLALGISAVLPFEAHWTLTQAWTYTDPLRSHLVTPATRWLFHRAACVYGFTNMPSMPPRPEETQARASSVRAVLQYARQAHKPVLGLAPEGGDAEGGRLAWPPAGVGRFILHLAHIGLPILPVGAFEDGERFCLRFGPLYRLEVPDGLSPEQRDRYASQIVMARIAALLPPELRGDFSTAVPSTGSPSTAP